MQEAFKLVSDKDMHMNMQTRIGYVNVTVRDYRYMDTLNGKGMGALMDLVRSSSLCRVALHFLLMKKAHGIVTKDKSHPPAWIVHPDFIQGPFTDEMRFNERLYTASPTGKALVKACERNWIDKYTHTFIDNSMRVMSFMVSPAEAKEARKKVLTDIAKTKTLAFCMGLHRRLGHDSAVHWIDDTMAHMISEEARKVDEQVHEIGDIDWLLHE